MCWSPARTAKAVAEAAAKLDGVKKVLLADARALRAQLAEPTAALIVSLAGNYDAIVAPSTTSGKNIMPRVAALLDVMQISDITKVIAPDTFERPIYAGNAIQTVKSSDAKKVITVRTSTFPATGDGGSATVENIDAAGGSGAVVLRRRGAVEVRSAGADLGQDHHLRRPRHAEPREFHEVSSSRSPTSSAPRLAPRAPRSTPAMRRTTGRSGRPARWWRRNSTSRSAFPALFSISPA